MSRFIGALEIEAERTERDGEPGYLLRDVGADPEDDPTWLPEKIFESCYLPVEDDIPQSVIDAFIIGTVTVPVADGSVGIYCTLANGFDLIAVCTPGEALGMGEIGVNDLALRRIKDRVKVMLQFTLRWARHGLVTEDSP